MDDGRTLDRSRTATDTAAFHARVALLADQATGADRVDLRRFHAAVRATDDPLLLKAFRLCEIGDWAL